MLAGVKSNFAPYFPDVFPVSAPVKIGRPESPRVMRAYRLVKDSGYISLDELCRKLKLSHDQTLNAIQTASIIEGSRIYEEMVNRKIYFGWLEV